MNNREFAAQDQQFRQACARAGIPPTARQASKWRAKDGKAWQQGRRAQTIEQTDELKEAS